MFINAYEIPNESMATLIKKINAIINVVFLTLCFIVIFLWYYRKVVVAITYMVVVTNIITFIIIKNYTALIID